jgi:tetratricopeptide (TPR) repeat protein
VARRFGEALVFVAGTLFLLGLALVVHGRARLGIVAAAGLLAVWCAWLGGTAASHHVHTVPVAAMVAVSQGDRAETVQDYAAAIVEYTKAIDIDPKYGLAYGRRANAYFNSGAGISDPNAYASTTSTTALQAALRDGAACERHGCGDDIFSIETYGAALFHARRFGAARVRFERVAALNPANPLSWINLTAVYCQLGSDAKARDALDRTIATIGDRPDAGVRAGLVAAALDLMQQVRRDKPSSAMVTTVIDTLQAQRH